MRVFTFLHNSNYLDNFRRLSYRTSASFSQYARQMQSMDRTDFYYGIITNRKSYAYELRLFAALPNLIRPSLQMADSLFKLAQESEVTEQSWFSFIANRPEYQQLRETLDERWIE
jgi:hypothetical protein